MVENYKIYIVDEEGIRRDAEILSKFKLSNQNNYIAYTFNEYSNEGMVKIYVTGVNYINGLYTGRQITSDEEWTDIKTILKTLAKSKDEPFPDSLNSDLNLLGEEIDVRNPKKLLVSQKFESILQSKFSEKNNTVSNKVVEEKAPEVPKKEENMERTIEIPTFEELQARSKNIQNAMNNVKEETKPPVTKEPEKEETKEDIIKEEPSKVNYEEQFKKDVEPLLLDVYAKQQKHIEELEEELSKTKFNLFEKQKETLSLSNEKEQIEKRSKALENELDNVQKKMNGILDVLKDNK